MYQNNIKELPKLSKENYENVFNLYVDDDGKYFYNILQNVIIPDSLPAGYYNEYTATYGDTWPFVSYKVYNTPNLWWLILTVNKIINPVKQPTPGQIIKYLKMEYAKTVINEINTQEK